MKNKKTMFLGVVVLVVIIAVVGLFLFNKYNVCKDLDDERDQECKLCKGAEDPIDCRDVIYGEVAFSNQDLSLCDNIVRDYRKGSCILRTEMMIKNSLKRGESKPVFTSLGDEEGFEKNN